MHGLAHRLVAAEREREVGDAAGNVRMRQVLSDPARRLDEVDAVIIVFLEPGRDRKDVRVEDDVFGREAELTHQDIVGAFADFGLARERIGLPGLVERHHDDGGAMALGDPGLVDEFLHAFLHRDRVHHRLALNAFQAGLDHAEFRGIHHHGNAGDIGLGGDEVEERHHRGFGIQQAFVHVDVDDLRAVLDLVARHLKRCGVVARGDQLAEFSRACDVGALADIDEGDRLRQRERLEARKPQAPFDHGNRAGLVRGDGGGNRRDMVRRGAAAAADDVDEAGLRKLADQARHIFRGLVILAELVRQAGVRIGAHQRVGDAADIGDMGAQIFRAERAVEADGDRPGVPHRIPERFRQLPGEQAAGFVGDGARNHHGHVDAARFGDLGDGVERRLGVQRVEDGFDQQHIGAAVQQVR